MVFITGATGLLGSYLTKLLIDKGEKVRALKRSTSNLSLLGKYTELVEWIEGDVLDISSLEEAMKGVDKVYHCAALISFLPSDTDYMMKVNVDGTANVMNAAICCGVKKVLHVSSEAAFGFPTAGKIIDEKYADPHIVKRPRYYLSKQYGEREAWRAHAEGLDVVIVCPGTVLGAGFWHTQPNILFTEIYNGLKFYTSATNGFIDVRDAVSCMYQLMESSVSGEKFLLVAENISMRNVMFAIADSLKVKRPYMKAGNFFIDIAWRYETIKSLLTGKPAMLTKESALITKIDFLYSNKKLIETLNCQFRPLQQTIEETAEAFLKSKQAGNNFATF